MKANDSWHHFTQALEAAGAIVAREETPGDEITRAEGQRHLARLIAMGLETALDRADPAHPVLARKLFSGGDTSDCRYLDAHIDGRYRYRLHGERGTAPLFEATVYDGKIGAHEESAQLAFLTEEDLEVAADGRFDVTLSPERQAGNWLETPANARYLMVRQYAHDWSRTRPARLRLDCTSPTDAPAPLDDRSLDAGLQGTARFVESIAARWASIVDAIRCVPPNVLIPVPLAVGALSLPGGHRFATGHFALAPDEVLSIRFTPPRVPYWGLQLTNYWFEPIDYGGVGSHHNDRSVVLEPDGRVVLHVSERDSGRPNWLDTRRHPHGTMQFRSSRGPGLELPEFETSVDRCA